MSFRKRQTKIDESGPDMTPMLDIVFIMLIFFIVTATFLDESGLDFATFPDQPPCTDCPTPPNIQVYVDSKNQASIDQRPAELSNVASLVEARLADKPNANIILTSHFEASLDPIVQIKDQMQAAGRKTVIKIVRD